MCPLCGAVLAMKDTHTKEQVIVEGFLLGAVMMRLQALDEIPPVMENLCKDHKQHMHRICTVAMEADPKAVPDSFKKQIAFVVRPNLKAV